MHQRWYAIQHRLDNVLRGLILEGRDRILARIRRERAGGEIPLHPIATGSEARINRPLHHAPALP